MRIIVTLLMICAVASASFAQETTAVEKEQYVVIPSDTVLLVVASPPDCPLQIENPRLLMGVHGKSYAFSFDVRNTSSKPIARWQMINWTWLGTGGTLSGNPRETILMPGDVIRGTGDSIVPLTEELKKKLNLEKYRGGMIALLVNSVVFTDGATYSNSSFVETVHDYFEQLATNLNKLENLSRPK